MDEFVEFNFLSLDATGEASRKVTVAERGTKKERVDLVARQFREFLKQGGTSEAGEAAVRNFIMTDDFRLTGHAAGSAGWLAFLVSRGSDGLGELEEVARIVFAKADDEPGRRALQRLAPYLDGRQPPPAPLAVAVRLATDVPPVVTEWLAKAAAGFFSDEF